MSRRLSLLLLTSAALIAAGCQKTGPKPPTVVPAPPTIESFTVSEAEVAAGGQVTLSWKVTQASSIELSNANTGALASVASDQFEGSTTVTITEDSAFVLTARGEAGSDVKLVSVHVPGTQPSLFFRALPENIVGGQMTTLAWNAPGAASVTITDASNAAVDLKGQASSGAVLVAPTQSTSYTLTADGRTATVQVTVGPAVLEFSASAATVDPGAAVTLSWKTAGAESVKLSLEGAGDLVTATDAATVAAGSHEYTVPANYPNNGVLAYTLTVTGSGTTLTKNLLVYVGAVATIDRFEAPQMVKAGQSMLVSWQTSGADTVTLKVDGVVVYRTATAVQAANGSFALTAPMDDFTVSMDATNVRGGAASRQLNVDVVTAPTMATLTASPTTVAIGSPVTLTWNAPQAYRVVVTDSDGRTVGGGVGPSSSSGSAIAYPSKNTTYTVTADNTLGDPAVTGTVDVTVTGGAATLTPTPAGSPVIGVAVPLTYSGNATATLYGLPHTNIQTSSVTNFEDISLIGHRIPFGAAANDELVTISPSFSTFLFSQVVGGDVAISTNGWLQFGATATDPYYLEKAIPGTAVPTNLIAPFWDDLRFTADSAIYWAVVGKPPESKLIVQWTDMQVGSTTGTKATFQAQVFQTGQIAFEYLTMDLSSSTYSSYSAGVQGSNATLGLSTKVSTPPASNSAVYLFSPVGNGTPVKMWPGIAHDGLVKLNGGYLRANGPTAIPLSSVQITEAMTHSSVPQGQYLELHNSGTMPVDLNGWQITTSANTTYVLDAGVLAADGGVLVLGDTVDRSLNDDAGVDLEWAGSGFSLPLSTTGTVALNFSDDAGVALAWDAGLGGVGISVGWDPTPYLFNGSSTPRGTYCSSRGTYGSQTPLQRGTPGTAETCGFAYTMSSIPSGYYDISATGTRVFNASVDSNISSVTLPATPNPLPRIFGADRQNLWLSANGFLLYATGSTSPANGNGNDSSPGSTSSLLGVLAPFWDDLANTTQTGADVYWQHLGQGEDPYSPAPHWIFQWHHFSYWLPKSDDLNFQIKIFDPVASGVDGVVEFHYGTMNSGSTSLKANGNTATEWFSDPLGKQALPIGVNQAVIAPNTAYRFTPQP